MSLRCGVCRYHSHAILHVMILVVGLGNPGKKYEKTRHNAGFLFVEKLADFLGWDGYYDVGEWKGDDGLEAQVCVATAASDAKVVFLKPMTFMNESGRAVRKAIVSYKIHVATELILAHDDLDIPLGSYKIQMDVAPKAHNGVGNVELAIVEKNFLRVRIGVDSREGTRDVPGDEYVLQKLNNEESILIDEAISGAIKQLRSSVQF